MILRIVVLLCVLFSLSSRCWATDPISKPDKSNAAKISGTKIIYKPPNRGAPKTRVPGGSRGGDEQVALELHTVTPEHTGWSATAKPVFYWYIDRATKNPITLTLVEEKLRPESPDPLVEVTLDGVGRPGIHTFPIDDDVAARLERGREYRWSVAIIFDPKQWSRNVVASATVLIPNESDGNIDSYRALSNTPQVAEYASTGYWYDAYHTLSVLIERNPSLSELQMQRKALHEQVGLNIR